MSLFQSKSKYMTTTREDVEWDYVYGKTSKDNQFRKQNQVQNR